MANARYTISFPSRETELIYFVEEKRKQGGMSAYIRGLVRKDMVSQDNTDFEKIYEYVLKRMEKDGHAISESGTKQTNEIIITEEDKDIILDLF